MRNSSAEEERKDFTFPLFFSFAPPSSSQNPIQLYVVLLRRKTAAASASAPDVPTASKALPASSLSLSRPPSFPLPTATACNLPTGEPSGQARTHAPPRTVISVRERIFPPSSGACVAREEEEGMEEEEEVKRRTRVSQQKRDLPTLLLPPSFHLIRGSVPFPSFVPPLGELVVLTRAPAPTIKPLSITGSTPS